MLRTTYLSASRGDKHHFIPLLSPLNAARRHRQTATQAAGIRLFLRCITVRHRASRRTCGVNNMASAPARTYNAHLPPAYHRAYTYTFATRTHAH